MSKDDKADPTKTYVLEETALTKKKSLDELAELATGKETEELEEDEHHSDK